MASLENQRTSWFEFVSSYNLLKLYFVHVPNFGRCQGRRTGVGVTTVSNLLLLGRSVTKVLKNCDEK